MFLVQRDFAIILQAWKKSVNNACMILFKIFTWNLDNCSLFQAKLSANMVLSCGSLWVSNQDFMNLSYFYYVGFYTWSFTSTSCCACNTDEKSQRNKCIWILYSHLCICETACGQNEDKHRLELLKSVRLLFALLAILQSASLCMHIFNMLHT